VTSEPAPGHHVLHIALRHIDSPGITPVSALLRQYCADPLCPFARQDDHTLSRVVSLDRIARGSYACDAAVGRHASLGAENISVRRAVIAAGLAIGTMVACGGSESHSGQSAGAGSGGVTSGGDGGALPGGTGGGSATGGNRNASGGGPPTDPNPTAACIYYVQVWCTHRFECGRYGDLEQCLIRNDSMCPDLFFSDGSNRTVEGLIACAQEWLDWPCEESNPGRSPDCVVPGTRAVGEPCINASQCANGRCAVMPDECGVCATVVGEGQDCVPDNVLCDAGLVCDRDINACVPYESQPEPSPIDPGEVCTPNDTCVEDYYCGQDPTQEDIARCLPLPVLGEGCPLPVLSCASGSYCSPEQVCEPKPLPGEPCGVDAFTGLSAHCDDTAYCDADAAEPTCTPLPGPGEPCTAAWTCAEGLRCMCASSPCTSRICVDFRYPGQECDAASTCHPASTCEDGFCSPGTSQGLFDELCGP